MPGEYPHSDDELAEIVDIDELAASLGLGAPGPGGSASSAGNHHHNVNNERRRRRRRSQQQQQYQALSPADGYFGRSDAGRSTRPPNAYPDAYNNSNNNNTNNNHVPISSQVPHVPDRWVSDPSLNQGTQESDKAREAREERQRDQNTRPFAADRQLDPNLTSTSPATDQSTAITSPSSAAFTLLNPQPTSVRAPTRDIHEDNNKYNNTHDFYSRTGPSSSTATSSRASAGAGPSFPPRHQFTPRYPSSSSPSAFHVGSAPVAAALPPHHHIARPRRSSTAYSERSSLFSEAPPAYTPSPTSPTTAASAPSSQYQTFSPPSPPLSSPPTSSPHDMGRPSESEARGLLVGQAYQTIPESMGGDPDQHDENEFTYPRPTFRERFTRFSFRRQWKMIVLALVLLFLTIGFLVTSIKGIKNEKNIKTPDESSPVVTRPKFPQFDRDGTRLAYPPYDNDMTWDQNRMCGDKTFMYKPQTFDLEFSLSRNISLFQDIKETTEQPANGKGVKVSGEVVIRRAASGTPGPAIVLETMTNDESMQLVLDWDDQQQQLYIMTPLMTSWPAINAAISPCVQVRATIWAPADSVIDSLNVEGVHLGVKLLDNLSLKLHSFARLASTVGSVVAATDGEKDARTLMTQAPPDSFALDTRYVEVKTMSSAIAGSWPLYDYLGLETIAGSIQAGVRPKPALANKPRPAILYARSTSGPIEVQEPIGEAVAMFAASQSPTSDGMSSTLSAESFVPPRQYGVDLFSMSGTVSGSVAFGYSAKVHTTSGAVTLNLLPVLDQAQAATPKRTSMVETSTTSGTTAITVLDALWRDTVAGSYVPAPVLASAPSPPTMGGGNQSVGARDPYDLLTPPSSSNVAARQQQQQQGAGAATAAAPSSSSSSQQNPALRILSARHSATSANLKLMYPPSWEGYIDCDSMAGKIDVGGKDVQIIKRENAMPGIKQHILAGKGDWNSVGAQVKVHTTSGNIGVTVAGG